MAEIFNRINTQPEEINLQQNESNVIFTEAHVVNINTHSCNLENKIHVLEIDNKHLIKKVENLETENKELKQENKELKQEIVILKQENKELKQEIIILKQENKTINEKLDELMYDKQNTKYSNLMSDIFKYFRDHILRNKLKEINYDKVISNVLKTLCENDGELTVDEVNDFKDKLILIGFNPDTIIELYDKNTSRNDCTHLIKSRYYRDKEKMIEYLNKYEEEINNMNENHEMYYIKNDILDFIKNLK
jgi:uncharacterized protein YhaN